MSQAGASKPELVVRVLAPTAKLYEGPAVSITAQNKVGPFDVLAGHANFFSLISASEVSVNTGSQLLTFSVSEGLLKVKNNTATLFVNIKDAAAA